MDASINLVPSGTILVHIGPHKTGTTSLQHALLNNRERALQEGVYYAAPEDRRSASNREARSLMKLPFTGNKVISYSVWEAQVSRVLKATAPRTFVSGEEFSFCEPKEIRTLIRDFGRERVRIVITARSLDKVLPSQWQLDLRGGYTTQSFDQWLRATLHPGRLRNMGTRIGIPHPFWFRHRHDQLAERWAAEAGVDRVTVVVGDERDHRVLLSAFESLLGLSDGVLVPPIGKTNASLSRDEAAMLLKVYELCHKQRLIITETGRKRLIQQVTQQLDSSGRSPTVIPDWATEAVQETATSIRDRLIKSGVQIAGDPTLLLGSRALTSVQKPADTARVADAAAVTLAFLKANNCLVSGSNLLTNNVTAEKIVRRLNRMIK